MPRNSAKSELHADPSFEARSRRSLAPQDDG
jgi:hypothetical protein